MSVTLLKQYLATTYWIGGELKEDDTGNRLILVEDKPLMLKTERGDKPLYFPDRSVLERLPENGAVFHPMSESALREIPGITPYLAERFAEALFGMITTTAYILAKYIKDGDEAVIKKLSKSLATSSFVNSGVKFTNTVGNELKAFFEAHVKNEKQKFFNFYWVKEKTLAFGQPWEAVCLGSWPSLTYHDITDKNHSDAKRLGVYEFKSLTNKQFVVALLKAIIPNAFGDNYWFVSSSNAPRLVCLYGICHHIESDLRRVLSPMSKVGDSQWKEFYELALSNPISPLHHELVEETKTALFRDTLDQKDESGFDVVIELDKRFNKIRNQLPIFENQRGRSKTQVEQGSKVPSREERTPERSVKAPEKTSTGGAPSWLNQDVRRTQRSREPLRPEREIRRPLVRAPERYVTRENNRRIRQERNSGMRSSSVSWL